MKGRALLLITFVGFTLIVAAKDVVSRVLLVEGLPVSLLLLVSGAFAFFIALGVAVVSRSPLAVQSYRYQAIRLVLDGAAWALASQAFKLLNATSISIVSKSYIPLLILIGPFLGNHFSRTQNALAFGALTSMVLFAFFNRAPNEALAGYGFLLLATLAVAASYIMLRHSTVKESPFVVVATPALACVAIGGLWAHQSGTPWPVSTQQLVLLALCGALIYGMYVASIYRYRVLPVGLAEYPTLLTVFVVLPAESVLFGFVPSAIYLANISIALALIGACVYLNLRK